MLGKCIVQLREDAKAVLRQVIFKSWSCVRPVPCFKMNLKLFYLKSAIGGPGCSLFDERWFTYFTLAYLKDGLITAEKLPSITCMLPAAFFEKVQLGRKTSTVLFLNLEFFVGRSLQSLPWFRNMDGNTMSGWMEVAWVSQECICPLCLTPTHVQSSHCHCCYLG